SEPAGPRRNAPATRLRGCPGRGRQPSAPIRWSTRERIATWPDRLTGARGGRSRLSPPAWLISFRRQSTAEEASRDMLPLQIGRSAAAARPRLLAPALAALLAGPLPRHPPPDQAA